MKNKCEVALGTTPMSFLVRFWQEVANARANKSAMTNFDLDCMTNAQYTLGPELAVFDRDSRNGSKEDGADGIEHCGSTFSQPIIYNFL